MLFGAGLIVLGVNASSDKRQEPFDVHVWKFRLLA